VSRVSLVKTSPAAAEATVQRLGEAGIEAEIVDRPNVVVRWASGGNYRVSVSVAAEALETARAEVARWEVESAPRIEALAREVQRGVLLASLPALAMLGWLLSRRNPSFWQWWVAVGLWALGLGVWGVRSRRRVR